ncbi:MAG: hypothetical protein PHT57_15780 [Rhodoferax sp.]|nr:hypothetical protein [Rhodoferax sp.]
MLDQVEAFFSLLERFKRYLAGRAQPPQPESLPSRFLRLFEAHGVHRNQIPRFFGHGLQLKDVKDEAALLPCLTNEHLADACQLFGVERKWLERGEGNAHVRRDFHLQPLMFGAFLDDVLAARTVLHEEVVKAELFGVLEPHRELDSTMVISEPIGLLNDEVIYRYYHVDGGPLGYWKSRVSVTAMVAQALARKLWITGRDCKAKQLAKLAYDDDLWAAHGCDDLMTGSRRMDVEDWMLEPDALLQCVDPETNRFGIASALDLWLKLESEGLMKHPFAKPDRRAAFQAAMDAEKLYKHTRF